MCITRERAELPSQRANRVHQSPPGAGSDFSSTKAKKRANGEVIKCLILVRPIIMLLACRYLRRVRAHYAVVSQYVDHRVLSASRSSVSVAKRLWATLWLENRAWLEREGWFTHCQLCVHVNSKPIDSLLTDLHKGAWDCGPFADTETQGKLEFLKQKTRRCSQCKSTVTGGKGEMSRTSQSLSLSINERQTCISKAIFYRSPNDVLVMGIFNCENVFSLLLVSLHFSLVS